MEDGERTRMQRRRKKEVSDDEEEETTRARIKMSGCGDYGDDEDEG